MKVTSKQKILIQVIVFVTLFFAVRIAIAQGTRSDYERAFNLGKVTANKVFRQRVNPHWFADNTKFWYRNDLADDARPVRNSTAGNTIPKGEISNGAREFILVNAQTGTRQPAFDHQRLAETLARAIGKEIQANRLPIDGLKFNDSTSELLFTSEGKRWNCDLSSYEIQEVSKDEQAASSLQPHAEPHPSIQSDEETSVTFTNSTDGDVELYWVDFEGERRHYATIRAGEQHQQHTFTGHVWVVTDKAGKMLAVFIATAEAGEAIIDETSIREAATREKPKMAKSRGESPDGKWLAFIKDYNLYLRNLETNQEFALSSDGTAEDAYSEHLHWSPDSQKLVVVRIRKGEDRKVYVIESSPKEQLQPKLHTFSYAKPGDKIDISSPQLFDVVRKCRTPISDQLFPNPWSISEIRWAPDSSRFTFLYNQRGHQVLRIVSVDAVSGETRAIIDEHSSTFIDYESKQFSYYLDPVRKDSSFVVPTTEKESRFSNGVDATKEIIWMSERDGWNHLYLYDAQNGSVKNQITKGQWVVRDVEHVDEAKRQIWFRAGGIRDGQDPYYVHFCRVNFDGSDLIILTEGDGNHEIEFSPDRRFFLDKWSRVEQPPITELRSAADGKLVCELERADWSKLLETGWRSPERFVAKGRDGKTDIYGIIIHPSNFDPNLKYPVIEEIYAGPQGAFVPKSFGLQTRQRTIAELGFIVVQIDGMGTSYRSKAFHDVCWKNLGDSGFPDRILWMQAAAAKYPYMDITRVGIYGGSAGGQSALRALLAFGDFYKVAVADCGCHDNRMDKIWWNELWMGWPVGPHYEEQSNVTNAHKLQGKLLLTAGELDRNVDPASTMQVVNALIKADKDFELLIVPGQGHGVGETPYTSRRRMDFFVRHLLGVEPRSQP
jgi:dipeptidyl aminopeptidase/acylaminoacyl peptidase